MAIEKLDNYNCLVSCDKCSYSDDLEESHFDQVIEIMKKNGWELNYINKRWIHSCPDCVSKDNA